MHIKALEICGFKSFVDRTTIHFDHDVIGIVGPNGCGKSNIVDAIRWCMGEQSARHLRGRSMEDVIFNGSESRGPHGFAEVTITFDNSNPAQAAELPEEYRHYPDIAITRRLYRDGTSEYLINKTQVRLRDVTDLFLGTGVGTKAYSIVEQGRIGQIVSARPEDRRIFIEEAAGITKYKVRRKQAERKIELTRQNLLRISDIVSEIERTRNSLKRQVAKAERYLEYRAELEELSLYEASHKYLEFMVLARVAGEAYGQNTERAAEVRSTLESLEDGLDDQRLESLTLETEADEMARAAFEADNDITGLQSEIGRCRDRMAHLGDRLRSMEAEQVELRGRGEALLAERASAEERTTELDRDQRTREMDAVAEVETLDALRSEETRVSEQVQQARLRLGETNTRSASLSARLDGLVARESELRSRRERLDNDLLTVQEEMAELEARRATLERKVAELAEGKRLSAEEKRALEQQVTDLRARLFDSEKRADAAKNELGVRRNRLRALEDLHRKHEGVGVGVRALLSFGDPAVHGLVADRLEAPAPIQTALAGLLGEQLQYVVVSDMERGVMLLGRLQAERRGRATLISSTPAYVAGGRPSLPSEPGVIGFLIDQLRYAPTDEALARSLVGNAILVETASHALALQKTNPLLTLVARDGTVVRSSGVLAGGVGDEIAAHLLEQKRELRLLGEEVVRLEATYTAVAAEHSENRTQLAETTTALELARQEAHQGELAHVTAEKDLSQTLQQVTRSVNRIEAISSDVEDIAHHLSTSQAEISTMTVQLDELQAAKDALRSELQMLEEQSAEWRERVSAQSSTVTERKVRLAQIREQLESSRASLHRIDSALADLDTRHRRLDEDSAETASLLGEAAAKAMLAREGHGLAEVRSFEAHQRLAQTRERLETTRHALAEREQGLRGLREELDQVETVAREAEMTLARLQIENNHLLATIREKFRGLELPTVIGDYHARPIPDAEQHRRIVELGQLIDRMGPVNLDARAEYEDAEKRFVDLAAQKTDLEKALDDLEKAIKLMNKESRKRFREAFDAINELFKAGFVRNFRGGRAELVLTDSEDLLGTGVDIIAQPPGKKLGNIELMSGGEKALTATSLIFAIFQYKPSPFCILDEVDAPLDEANVARYNEAIRAMTDRSQFILITHIRKTMQSTDVLYGVTMGEPGVSRIVSVKVNDHAAARSESIAANALRGSTAPAAEAQSTEQVA